MEIKELKDLSAKIYSTIYKIKKDQKHANTDRILREINYFGRNAIIDFEKSFHSSDKL